MLLMLSLFRGMVSLVYDPHSSIAENTEMGLGPKFFCKFVFTPVLFKYFASLG